MKEQTGMSVFSLYISRIKRKCGTHIAKKWIMCYDTYNAMRGKVLRYTIFNSKIRGSERLTLERNVEIVTDSKKKKIVKIHDIRFQGKRSIDWKQVREYLKDYVGAAYEIAETKDIIYIGSDLPDEYSGSRYTYKLMGTLAKAKANAAQGIPELLETALNKRFLENHDPRHIRNAGYGWYRYDTYFELPVYDGNGEIERYNRFKATMLIRHSADGKKYLYDMLDIKKETSNSLSS